MLKPLTGKQRVHTKNNYRPAQDSSNSTNCGKCRHSNKAERHLLCGEQIFTFTAVKQSYVCDKVERR